MSKEIFQTPVADEVEQWLNDIGTNEDDQESELNVEVESHSWHATMTNLDLETEFGVTKTPVVRWMHRDRKTGNIDGVVTLFIEKDKIEFMDDCDGNVTNLRYVSFLPVLLSKYGLITPANFEEVIAKMYDFFMLTAAGISIPDARKSVLKSIANIYEIDVEIDLD